MFKQGFVQAAITAATIATVLAGETGAAQAHHGWSEYNNQQTMTLTGTIERVDYQSPHTTIQLKTKERTWRAVLAPPSRMQQRGLPANALRVGQSVSVIGYPHRRESNEMRAERIQIGDRTVKLR